jgi:hypothetical protein
MPVVVLCLEGDDGRHGFPTCRNRAQNGNFAGSPHAGCHGSGKTALTAEFRAMGFTVMDEGFLSQPPTLLHPQVRIPLAD